MAYALNHGAHIRVSMVLNKLGRWRRLGELWCFGIGSALAIYFAYYSYKGAYLSYLINDVSQGQDATPLWIPQIPMALGTSILALDADDLSVAEAFRRDADIDILATAPDPFAPDAGLLRAEADRYFADVDGGIETDANRHCNLVAAGLFPVDDDVGCGADTERIA